MSRVTTMRKMMTALALLGLAGCTGTTGGSYSASSQYAHEREMILAGSGPAAGGAQGASALAAPAVSSQPLSAMGTTAGAGNGSAVASQTDAMLNATAAAPEAVNEIGISEENNFEAVGEQRSREEDAALIAANRARYEQVQPTALPQREATGPNIVAYALNSTNPKGVQIYQRGSLFTESRNARNCSKFPSPDMAQRQFLASGGPQKDPKALDPDGDGYACSWDPAPFRKAAAAANG